MAGTPGYLRIPEAYEMAEELEEYIGTLDGKVFSCKVLRTTFKRYK